MPRPFVLFDAIRIVASGKRAFYGWLHQERLLNLNAACPRCNSANPTLQRCRRRKLDGFLLYCRNSECNLRYSIRTGSIFEQFNRSTIKSILYSIILFENEESFGHCVEISGKSRAYWTTLFHFCRRAIWNFQRQNPVVFGGGDEIIEIDESYWSRLRKFQRGRYVHTGKWVVGLLSRRTGIFHGEVVPNCKKVTIRPIVQAHVILGATICSDDHRSYRQLTRLGYRHFVVNHSAGQFVRFNVDGRGLACHTQSIEGFWGNAKTQWRAARGRKVADLDLFMAEKSFRSRQLDFYALFECW